MKIYRFVSLTALCLLVSFLLSAQTDAQRKKAYVVSNAHFDTQWNWDVQRSINEFIPKTLNQNLFLLGKYPHYLFNFEGGIKYFWMKEYYPHQYELMKSYVKEGRWHVTGSSWDANDVNIPAPESFTRNILYGQLFYEEEFGVRGTDIFLPDCFGFGWTLPTLAAHSGLIGFSTQKLMWRTQPFYGESKIPFEIGLWQGVDGARIMLVADAHNYTTKWKDEDLSESETLQDMVDKSPVGTVYHYYGTGDTGGAPTIESVRSVEKGVKGAGALEIISATSDQLYKDFLPYTDHPELPLYNGELLMDVHGTGCYSSQAAMKLFNRKNELLADAAERAAVAADWLKATDYPKSTLTEAWRRVIWHQFHDDLTGTSIPRAYEFSWNDELISMKQFANVLTTSVGAVSSLLDTRVKGIPLVIYNPVSQPVADVIEVKVALSQKALRSGKIAVYDEQGAPVPSQLLAVEQGVARLLVAASAPAAGYVVYDIREGNEKAASALKVDRNAIENSVYKITLNEFGDLSSIVDKRSGRELVKQGKAVRLALFTENESFNWPAWEILKQEIDKNPVNITEEVRISVAEEGAVRAALCVERKQGGSVFKQYIRLTEGGQKERIDLLTEVNWQTTNALLKAEFPLAISSPKATYDLGIGAVERGNNTATAYEVPAQYWADLTDQSQNYGVSVLNDCKYGWDKPDDQTLRLTLLHTPKTKQRYTYQSSQDFGYHRFTYSIVGHEGSYQEAQTVLKAEALNQSLKAFVADGKHDGKLGRQFSFVKTDNARVLVKALKQAERSDEYVVRLYETSGQPQPVTLDFAGTVLAAKELNGVEDEIGALSAGGKQVSITVPAYGIKTIKVRLETPSYAAAPIQSAPLELKYNLKTASFNAFRSEANFDGSGRSYAAELLPAQIEVKGIPFRLAPGDEANGLRCKGDTIQLPQGEYNRIYFLAASTRKDSKVVFTIDGRPVEAVIPVYSGFIGQWGHAGHTEAFLKNADIAYVGTHTHDAMGNRDLPHEYTYIYSIALDLPKKAKEVTLPFNSQVVLFAATVVNDRNNGVRPAVELLPAGLPEKKVEGEDSSSRYLLTDRVVVGKSGEVNSSERAENAIDENNMSKWCDVSDARPKQITVDMGKEETVKGWIVRHAGMEALDYITKEYSLQVKSAPADEWKTVDSVADNSSNETDRLIATPVKARYVRLSITKPDQSEGRTARVYEFNVY
jgi:alpha-mannosidase